MSRLSRIALILLLGLRAAPAQRADAQAPRPSPQPGDADAWLREAGALVELDRNREALKAYAEAGCLYAANGTPARQGRARAFEAALLNGLGHPEEALAAALEAAVLLRSSGSSPSDQAYSAEVQGKALAGLGRVEEALLAFEESEITYAGLGSSRSATAVLVNRAVLMEKAQGSDEAARAYGEAGRLFQAAGTWRWRGGTPFGDRSPQPGGKVRSGARRVGCHGAYVPNSRQYPIGSWFPRLQRRSSVEPGPQSRSFTCVRTGGSRARSRRRFEAIGQRPSPGIGH